MDKSRDNFQPSECMPLAIQTKNIIFYLDYLNMRIQQLRMRINNVYLTNHKLAPNILEIIPVKCKKMLYFDLCNFFEWYLFKQKHFKRSEFYYVLT